MSEDDLDMVLHAGDYLYEDAPRDGRPRQHVGPEPVHVDTHRMRYALYRSDSDLQAAHAAFPFVCTWDDHGRAMTTRVHSHRTSTIRRRSSPGALPPIRPTGSICRCAVAAGRAGRTPSSTGGSRSATSPRCACSTRASTLTTRPVTATGRRGPARRPSACLELDDPARTLLGAEQARWLLDGLAASSARWNVLASSTRRRSRMSSLPKAWPIGLTGGTDTAQTGVGSCSSYGGPDRESGGAGWRYPLVLGHRLKTDFRDPAPPSWPPSSRGNKQPERLTMDRAPGGSCWLSRPYTTASLDVGGLERLAAQPASLRRSVRPLLVHTAEHRGGGLFDHLAGCAFLLAREVDHVGEQPGGARPRGQLEV